MDTGASKDNFTIKVYCDPGITDKERDMILCAIKESAILYGCCFRLIQEPLDLREEIAPNEKDQIDSTKIMDLLQSRSGAKDHKGAVVFFTSKDLYLKDTWCFGAARVGGGVSVQSVYRYQKLSDDDKQAAITRTLRHEIGHIHLLASDLKRANTRRKFGIHCTSKGCTMRQSGTLKELLLHAKEEDPGDCLCDLCKRDLERFKERYY